MKVGTHDTTLGFQPHARGFAYVVFEGPHLPVDWGMSDVPREERGRRCLRRLSSLFDQYKPDALVLPDTRQGVAKAQYATLLQEMAALAQRRGVPAVTISRKQVRDAFAYLGHPTRHAISEAIAREIPTFLPLVPPVRKIWNGEDRRMGLFDAAALALTFYWHKHNK